MRGWVTCRSGYFFQRLYIRRAPGSRRVATSELVSTIYRQCLASTWRTLSKTANVETLLTKVQVLRRAQEVRLLAQFAGETSRFVTMAPHDVRFTHPRRQDSFKNEARPPTRGHRSGAPRLGDSSAREPRRTAGTWVTCRSAGLFQLRPYIRRAHTGDKSASRVVEGAENLEK
jgi:hypothetical protein